MAENFPELIRHQNTTPESFSGNQVEQIPKKHPPPKKKIKLLKTKDKDLKASGKKTDNIQRNKESRWTYC